MRAALPFATVLVAMLKVAAVAQAPAASALPVRSVTPATIDAEAQAVYRAALQLRFTTDPTPLIDVTLLQQTRAVLPPVCSLEEKVPQDWRPVVDSYKRENVHPQELPANISVGMPRTLMSLDSLKSMMRAAGYDLGRDSGWLTPGAEVFARLTGGQLVVVSAVGFNPTRTRAMLTVQSNCFPSELPEALTVPCQEGRQLLMESQFGRWVPVDDPGLTCMWTP